MLYREVDGLTAVEAAYRLSHLPNLAFLDSALRHPHLGRYSYVAADPFARFQVRSGLAYLNDEELEGNPFAALRSALARYRSERVEGLPPFQGGCIGYLSYGLARCVEKLPPPTYDTGICDDLSLQFYDVVLAFDHVENHAWLLSSGFPERETGAQEERARQRLEGFARTLAQATVVNHVLPPVKRWRSNFTSAEFEMAVERVQEHIRRGDIYQANISQRFSADLPSAFDPWQFYLKLRTENAATFGAFLALGDVAIASSSPERFLRLEGRHVETRPIKGTAPRVNDPEADRRAADELEKSEKDRAENIMIVDLMRNDLSRVCEPGTVEVAALCVPESYASVHHLVSVVVGRLAERADFVDLLLACFPGGSITGAPKLRAMEIINEIEQWAREVYCGSIGYIGFDGSADFNIAIRTVVLDTRQAIFSAGAGITLLSDPRAEFMETLTKASRIFSAFGADAMLETAVGPAPDHR